MVQVKLKGEQWYEIVFRLCHAKYTEKIKE
jgi:hypothetical protein